MKRYELGNLKVNSMRHEIVADGKYNREKHIIRVSNGKINKYFTYTTEVVEYINRENLLKNALWCIYMDYMAYENHPSLEEVVDEYGYNYKDARRVFNSLKKSHERFTELLDDGTLELLEEVYQDY
mgnify:FL=1